MQEENAIQTADNGSPLENSNDAIYGDREHSNLGETLEVNTSEKLPKPRARRARSQDDCHVQEAFKILQNMNERYSRNQSQMLPNRFSVYGQHVANKLLTYSLRTAAIVEHKVNNILFEVDMGVYETISLHGQDLGSLTDHTSSCISISENPSDLNNTTVSSQSYEVIQPSHFLIVTTPNVGTDLNSPTCEN